MWLTLYQSSPSTVAARSMHMMWQVGDKQGPYFGQNSDQSSSSSELEPVEVGWAGRDHNFLALTRFSPEG